MEKLIQKTEKVSPGELVKFLPGEEVFIPQYDIVRSQYSITKWTVTKFAEGQGILVLEGLATLPNGAEQKVKYNVNVLETRVFKEFDRAKLYLQQALARFAMNISKILPKIEEMEEPGEIK